MKARKKPIEVECFQLGGKVIPDWFFNKVITNEITLMNTAVRKEPFQDTASTVYADIRTLEGTMRANNGDWIIQGVNGEIYPCKPDIFEKTYDLVGE